MRRRSRALVYEHRTDPLLSRRAFVRRVATHGALVLALIAISIVGGMAGYMGLAGMSAVDAFLNASMLLGGMGPVGDLPNDSSKIFAGFYALYAGLIFIVSAGVIIAPVAHRIFHRLHLQQARS
jgi:hypothetical protein